MVGGKPSPTRGNYCTACGVQIGDHYHHSSEQHIRKCKDNGLYCYPCKIPFLNEDRLLRHELKSHAHEANTHGSGGSGYREETGPGQVVHTMMPAGEKFCAVCDGEYSGRTEDHLQTQYHLGSCKKKGLYCTDCNIAFASDGLLQHHILGHNSSRPRDRQPPPSNPAGFNCGHCDRLFSTSKKLKKHSCGSKAVAENITPTPTSETFPEPVAPSPWPGFYCEVCKIYVGAHATTLSRHLQSAQHIDSCKLVGLYCFLCQTPFSNEANLSAHNLIAHQPHLTYNSPLFQNTIYAHQQASCAYGLLNLSANNSITNQPHLGYNFPLLQSATYTQQPPSYAYGLPDPAGFNCGNCNQVFATSIQLENHPCVSRTTTTSKSPTYTQASRAFPPYTAQSTWRGCFCEVCKIHVGVEANAIGKHLQSPEHINMCKLTGLYCLPCQRPFMNETTWSRHNSMKHPNSSLQSPIHTHQPPQYIPLSYADFSCGRCNKAFQTSKQLEKHSCFPKVCVETPTHLPTPEAPPIQPATPSGYLCEVCKIHVTFEEDETASHQRSTEHIEQCKLAGLYCLPCQKLFLNADDLSSHNSMNHSQFELCTICGGEFSDAKEHEKLERHIEACKSQGIYCLTCNMVCRTGHELQSHIRAAHTGSWPNDVHCSKCNMACRTVHELQTHIRTIHIPEIRCSECNTVFSATHELQSHIRTMHTPSRPSGFHCCDCNKNFPSNSKFLKHIRRGGGCVAKKEKPYSCDECSKGFSSKKGLSQHCASTTHMMMQCIGSKKCKKTFRTLPDMLQHLESGSCRSKLNRAAIDALMRKHDPAGAITIQDAPTTAGHMARLHAAKFSRSVCARREEVAVVMDAGQDDKWGWNGLLAPNKNMTEAAVVTDPNDDVKGEWDNFSTLLGDVTVEEEEKYDETLTPESILTPESGLTPMYTLFRRNSTASTSTSVLIPTVRESSSHMASPRSCSICFRTFPSTTGLQMHMASPVHAPPMYHCPIDFLGSVGLDGKGKHKKEKVFKTLSALAQHIEAGACKRGDDSWKKAVGLLEGTLKGLGFSGAKLLGQ